MNTKEIISYVNAHGLWAEGYGVQQRQTEIAALVEHVLPDASRYRNFLEIGAAAGGTARLLDDFIHFDVIHLIDDNALGLEDRRHVNLPNAVEWIGNACSPEAMQAVAEWGIAFDLVHIDAGHTYECVKADTLLAVSVAAPGAVIFFHDVLCCEGITQWMTELLDGAVPGLEYITTFGNDLGIGVCRWNAK